MSPQIADDGAERITGRYLGPGAECPQFRTADGETVSLSNVRDADLVPGSTLSLVGRWQMISRCMQGRDFRVERIEISESD